MPEEGFKHKLAAILYFLGSTESKTLGSSRW
jgi:hypothetical protein